MELSAADVAIVDVTTCDFSMVPRYSTDGVLDACLGDDADRYRGSAAARQLIADKGVCQRHLTHLPGQLPHPGRLNALDLARSAARRMMRRHPAALARLDAIIFVSTSNPNPCNSQAALVARDLGITASCLDLKAGCSAGVLGIMQAALLIGAGCRRVLVVASENLSHLVPRDDLRMLLSTGDGAACILLERRAGPGFLAMAHGTAVEHAHAVTLDATFPPVGPDDRFALRVQDATAAATCIDEHWRSALDTTLRMAALGAGDLAQCFVHQAHRGRRDAFLAEYGIGGDRCVDVLADHGNAGSATFAIAMARRFAVLRPGERYLMQAVGGGISWCAIIAEHR
jgi:3-oxoacyl-[acyl-carrier-protein] synthase-3